MDSSFVTGIAGNDLEHKIYHFQIYSELFWI